MIIKAIQEPQSDFDEALSICTGELRYRANWMGQLIVQIQKKRFISGKGQIREWVDAKPYQIALSEDI